MPNLIHMKGYWLVLFVLVVLLFKFFAQNWSADHFFTGESFNELFMDFFSHPYSYNYQQAIYLALDLDFPILDFLMSILNFQW